MATVDTEAQLLEYAAHTTGAQFEKVCRLFRQTQREHVPTECEPERWVHQRSTLDSMVRLTIQVRPEEAATLTAAMESASDGGKLVDGLMAMAEETARGDKPHRPPAEVVVHIDADTLTGQLPDGSGVPAEVCERLLCDAGIVPVLEDEHGRTSMWDESHEAFRRRFGGHFRCAMRAAVSRAAITSAGSTHTMYTTGRAVAKLRFRTPYFYARYADIGIKSIMPRT